VRAWRIWGGTPLRGEVRVGGSKYSALAAIPACCLADGPCVLHNVPDILDVRSYLEMLEACGAEVERAGSTVRIDARGLRYQPLPRSWSASMRASPYMLAVQLVRWGTAEVGLPGGDRIGTRPLDLHVKALRALGAEVGPSADGAALCARAARLRGAHIYLDQPSVGATVQALLAAVCTEGETRIDNAYVGPFIVDLANFLCAMGAQVRGAGTSTVRVRGVSALHGAEHTLIGDQAEAFTYLAAGAATGGHLRVTGIEADDVGAGLTKLQEAGAECTSGPGWIEVRGPERLRAVDVQTGPLPAFYTDYHPPFAAALATASGVSRIVETQWRERFGYAEGLRVMGAEVRVEGCSALIRGARLHGATVQAGESRAAAAYAIAGLCAAGETVVTGVQHVERVCEHFVEKLQGLGAAIREVALQPAAQAQA
jgi:UDP-N-acetylglucosamine 1-carboxyvinyltransferase